MYQTILTTKSRNGNDIMKYRTYLNRNCNEEFDKLVDDDGNELANEDLYKLFDVCLDVFKNTKSGSDNDEYKRQIAIVELLDNFYDSRYHVAYNELEGIPDDCYETFNDIVNGADKDEEFEDLSLDFIL